MTEAEAGDDDTAYKVASHYLSAFFVWSNYFRLPASFHSNQFANTMADTAAGRSSPNADEETQAQNGASERTPLLKPNGSHQAGDAPPAESTQEEETTVIAQEISSTRLALILGTSWLGVFLGAMDSTVIATLSAPISSEFQSLSLYSWLATAYLISNAACQPISGRLTDIFGRGPGLVLSNVLFAAGNMICGLAQDEYTMIFGRVVAGIGGGGLMSISTFVASDLVPLRKRGVYQGIGNICYGSGAMLGGIFGGLLNDHTKYGWRLAFLVQVPPVLVSGVAAFFLITIPPKQSDKSYLARIDFTGVLLTVSFLVLLLLGLNSGGNVVPWVHPLPLTVLPLSAVAFGGFLWWESKATQPIIPVKLLMTRTILAACLCNLLCTMVVMTGLFYVPLYLQVLGDTPTGAGIKILPSPVGVSVGSVTAGIVMNKTGRYVRIGISSLLSMIIGIVLFCLQNEHSPVWMTALAFFFVGSGYGAMLTTTLLACISAVEHSQQAVITSATCKSSLRLPGPRTNMSDLARSLGGTVGVTIGSAIYQNVLKARLWERFGDEPNAAEQISRIRDDLRELQHLPDGWYDGVIASFMEAFRGVWFTLLALGIGGLICVSLLKQHTLHSTLDRIR